MIGWLQLSDERRKASLDQAEQLSGIPAKVIEKDWWVTITLKALFQSAYREHMVFKGGTSLSKGWNLIARFSEDIDIAIDPAAFGMEYLETPNGGDVNRLKRRGCEFTSNELLIELKKQLLALGVPEGMLTIEAAPIPPERPDTDPQTLLVKYPSLYEPNPYIPDNVKVEVSVRSLRIPFTTVPIQSILHEKNPLPAYIEVPFAVEIVEPRKTFLEKLFLLHEEFGRPDKTKIRTQRMSRHLYDLYKMMHTPTLDQALSDHKLYNDLIKHRESYSRISWVDYNSLHHATIAFIPVKEVIADYYKDYQTMEEEMIYEDAVSFNDLIASLKLLQGKVRMKYEAWTLEEIIETAKQDIISASYFANSVDGSYLETTVSKHSDMFFPESPKNKSIHFTVGFFLENGQLIFESIKVTQ